MCNHVSRRWLGSLALVLCACFAGPARGAGADAILPCFRERAEPLVGHSRPDVEAPGRAIFTIRITCSAEVVRDPHGNELRLVAANPLESLWVLASEVHLDASRGDPSPAAWIATLRREIGEGRFERAAELATALYPVAHGPERAAAEVALGAVPQPYETDGLVPERARRAFERLARTGPVHVPDPPSAEEVAGPAGSAYVSAPRAAVRAGPDAGAPQLGVLPLGAAVELAETRGEFARVVAAGALAPRDAWEVAAGRTRRLGSAEARREGWIERSALASVPLERAALLERAARAEAEGRFADAFRDLERAAELVTPPADLAARLRRAAALSGRYREAVEVAWLPARTLDDGDAHAQVELSPPLRCRGDRLRAALVDPEVAFAPFRREEGIAPDALGAIPADACLAPLRTVACGCGGGRRAPGPMEQRLARELPDGPWIRVRVTAAARPFPEGDALYLFEVPADRDAACKRKRPAGARIFPGVPLPPPGGTREVWVRLDDVIGHRGAVIARDAAEARRRVGERIADRCATAAPRLPASPAVQTGCGC